MANISEKIREARPRWLGHVEVLRPEGHVWCETLLQTLWIRQTKGLRLARATSQATRDHNAVTLLERDTSSTVS